MSAWERAWAAWDVAGQLEPDVAPGGAAGVVVGSGFEVAGRAGFDAGCAGAGVRTPTGCASAWRAGAGVSVGAFAAGRGAGVGLAGWDAMRMTLSLCVGVNASNE